MSKKKDRSDSSLNKQKATTQNRSRSSLVLDAVKEIVGADAIPLVQILLKRDSVSEYELSDRIKKDINQTRNILYALHKLNLVTSVRKKDKIKGWYIYYWTFDADRLMLLYKAIQKKRLEQLNSILEREEKHSFFSCPNRCMRVDYEQAMSFNFKCPECGALMDREDNQERIAELKREIERIKQTLTKIT
ncbi:MAG: hypothetical protein QXT20_02730 [Candidatus Woesearchaeota archaeon]